MIRRPAALQARNPLADKETNLSLSLQILYLLVLQTSSDLFCHPM
jgi:hypothetical protein